MISTVLVTHYHEDHVAGIPLLQRLFGTSVWAPQHFADILERPAVYDLPGLWPEPINVEMKLSCGQPVQWDDIVITLHPMSGHTRFSAMLCLEIDGQRVVHTGDQVFFNGPEGFPEGFSYKPGRSLFTNHLYKGGLDLGGYVETWKLLKAFRPDWILTGHTPPYRIEKGWLEAIEQGAQEFDEVHGRMMLLGHEDVHFGPESRAGVLQPARVHLEKSEAIGLGGWVLNPFPHESRAELRLVTPDGWKSSTLLVDMGSRERAEYSLTLVPPIGARCRRQAIALDLTVNGRPFGQVAVALVTIGCEHF
jgi:glyoxylase-like metal-dependent hydrolase (beta-lactamase superfamily II)